MDGENQSYLRAIELQVLSNISEIITNTDLLGTDGVLLEKSNEKYSPSSSKSSDRVPHNVGIPCAGMFRLWSAILSIDPSLGYFFAVLTIRWIHSYGGLLLSSLALLN